MSDCGLSGDKRADLEKMFDNWEKEARINPPNPCPKCGDDGLGDVIPPEINRDEFYGPQGKRWGTHIGIEDPMVYDGISWWKCGECGHIWKRFSWSPDYVENNA